MGCSGTLLSMALLIWQSAVRIEAAGHPLRNDLLAERPLFRWNQEYVPNDDRPFSGTTSLFENSGENIQKLPVKLSSTGRYQENFIPNVNFTTGCFGRGAVFLLKINPVGLRHFLRVEGPSTKRTMVVWKNKLIGAGNRSSTPDTQNIEIKSYSADRLQKVPTMTWRSSFGKSRSPFFGVSGHLDG